MTGYNIWWWYYIAAFVVNSFAIDWILKSPNVDAYATPYVIGSNDNPANGVGKGKCFY